MNDFTKEAQGLINELHKNIERQKVIRMMQASCHHQWLSGSYMVKHCEKCGKVSNE